MKYCFLLESIFIGLACTCWLVLLVAASDTDYEETEDISKPLIELDDSNFEHLTQAATGSTTGDWLVLFGSDDSSCPSCSSVVNELMNAAKKTQGRINIAKVVKGDSTWLLFRRFKISKYPTILFFHLGQQWSYSGVQKSSAFVKFVNEDFKHSPRKSVDKPIDRLDAWYEDFRQELRACLKERRLPSVSVLLVLLFSGLVLIIIAGCLMTPAKKTEKKRN